jgi:hypothetical protein
MGGKCEGEQRTRHAMPTVAEGQMRRLIAMYRVRSGSLDSSLARQSMS